MIGELMGRSLTRSGWVDPSDAPLQDKKNLIECHLEETGFAILCITHRSPKIVCPATKFGFADLRREPSQLEFNID
jgi:hypothetical protein